MSIQREGGKGADRKEEATQKKKFCRDRHLDWEVFRVDLEGQKLWPRPLTASYQERADAYDPGGVVKRTLVKQSYPLTQKYYFRKKV